MENRKYVLDANVFLEYIYGRELQGLAKQLITNAILGKIEVIIPSLALDEISEVLCGNMDNLEQVESHLRYIEKLIYDEILKVVVPTTKIRMKAINIARLGNKKSGYPEFTDCLYHALAIFHDAIFITNDKKHIAKVKSFGHIRLLSSLKREEKGSALENRN